ncbi:MAG: hypothetical protein ACRDXX_13115 [Stackebrandtia sp.]
MRLSIDVDHVLDRLRALGKTSYGAQADYMGISRRCWWHARNGGAVRQDTLHNIATSTKISYERLIVVPETHRNARVA